MDRPAGRAALITGSDSGIGRAIAIGFAREGADIVVDHPHDREGADERAAEPGEIAHLAVFPASADAYHATGSTHVMDGGLLQMSGQDARHPRRTP